jgi:ABC-type multidrug transport system ATPase subunit
VKIHIKKLGVLDQADFELGDMTILCGANNTGKTYATYALYGLLKFWRDIFSVDVPQIKIETLLSTGIVHIDLTEYIEQAPKTIQKGCKAFTQQLPYVFASSKDHFIDSEFSVTIKKEEIRPLKNYESRLKASDTEWFSITKTDNSNDLVIALLVDKSEMELPVHIVTQIIGNTIKHIIFSKVFINPFIASAERTGAAIFRKELNFARNRLLEQMSHSEKNVDPIELLSKVYQDYALPVTQNVDFTRQLETISKQKSYLAETHPELLDAFSDIIGGAYTVNRNDELQYVPKGKKVKLSMVESSSAVRSLLDIGFYLRHVAKKGDLLMVDEPELNLHPENQRKVARLFARLVNLDIKVFITTHSDYIIKEINTLIMLKSSKPHIQKIAKEEGYEHEELLSHEKLRVYVAEKALERKDGAQRKSRQQTLKAADIDPNLGIEVSSFDNTIDEMNRIQEKIIWSD